jgi:hypothetical protein
MVEGSERCESEGLVMQPRRSEDDDVGGDKESRYVYISSGKSLFSQAGYKTSR